MCGEEIATEDTAVAILAELVAIRVILHGVLDSDHDAIKVRVDDAPET